MPSKLRERFLGMDGELEKRDITLGQLFCQSVQADVPEFISEQVAKGGTFEAKMAACVVDALMLGYVAGRREERVFMGRVISDAIMKKARVVQEE